MRSSILSLFVFVAFMLYIMSSCLHVLPPVQAQREEGQDEGQVQPGAQQPASSVLPADQEAVTLPSGEKIVSMKRTIDDQASIEQLIGWWFASGAKTASDQAMKPQGEVGTPLDVTVVWAHVAVDKLRKVGGLKHDQSIVELIVGPACPYDFLQGGGGPDQRCSGVITNWRQSIASLEGLRERGLARLFWSSPVTIANRRETEIVLMPSSAGTAGSSTDCLGASPTRFEVVLSPILLEGQRVLLEAEAGVHFADAEGRRSRVRVIQPLANGAAMAIGGLLFQTHVETRSLKYRTPLVADVPWLGSLVTEDSLLAGVPLVGVVVPQMQYESLVEQMLVMIHIQRSKSSRLIAAPNR